MSSILNSNTVLEESQYSTVNEIAEHSIDILSDSDVESEDSSSIAYIKKKTFTIVDDNLFIADYSDLNDAPTWLKTLINTTATNKVYEANGSFLDSIQILINNLSNTYVQENKYTQAITNLNTQNANALFLINALDSTFQTELGKANAKILNIETTKASLSEVEARVLTVINAELNKNGSNLKTAIGNVSDAVTTEVYTRGLQYNGIISSIGDLDDDISANATATTNLYTYIGVNEDGTETGNGLLANSSAITNLQNGLQTTNGTVSAHTSELSTVNTRITNGLISAESKWAYNSNLTLNGVSYSSGFGLATSLNSGSIPVGQSEFWINADKLKMTTTGYNGTKYSPFIVNGSNGEITFNGKIAFTNVTGYTPPDVSGSINSNNDVIAQKLGYTDYAAMVAAAASDKTIVTGGFLRTSLIDVNSINASQINADSSLINKLNVTGGIVANNIIVPGVNGGNNLFSASGSDVVISNLKVLGTVSLPGISKGGSFAVPTLGVGSTYSVTVNKPYACNNWSVTAIVSLTNITGYGETTNFGCRLYVGGSQVSIAQGVSNWAINVSTTGTRGSLLSSSIDISINTSGFGYAAGSFYGSISYIAIVEN